MSLRTTVANELIKLGRKIGRKDGQSELAVFVSGHSIKPRMVDTDRDDLAWNPNLYRYGNLFIKGYANPIKVGTEPSDEHDNVKEATCTHVGSDGGEGTHKKLVRTGEYREFVKQTLLESVLNPSEKWRIIIYAVIGIAILQAATLMAALAAAGAF